MTELFADGIRMGESARWHDGRFWMSDWMAGEVLAFDAAGNREVITRVEGLPFCFDWFADGRLVLSTADGVRVGTDLRLYGAQGMSWNEVVVDPAGRAYVDQPGSMPHEPSRPGIVGLVTPDGEYRQVADDVWFPNGMAVTPDGSTLIVAESHARRLTAWTIADSGDLVDRRVWADLGDVPPDGICLDAEGALWVAEVAHDRCIRVAEGGEILQSVDVDRGCFSCTLGGDDGRTLFIVANAWRDGGASDGVVYTERVDVPAR